MLLAGNAGHADIPLDAPGSALMGMLLAMLGQTVGFPVPGGRRRRADPGAGRAGFRARGGEIRTGAEVAAIDVPDGRAVAVRTADGERYAAGRAVVADVLAPALYGGCWTPEDVPDRVARACDPSSSTRGP